jgi:hypothetical protein
MTLRTRLLGPLFIISLFGCTHWVRDDSVLQQPIPEHDQIEINASGMRVVGVGVRVDSQTVSYVEYFKDPACDSCRAVIPRASIDSVRVSGLSTSRNVVLGASLVVFYWLMLQVPRD